MSRHTCKISDITFRHDKIAAEYFLLINAVPKAMSLDEIAPESSSDDISQDVTNRILKAG